MGQVWKSRATPAAAICNSALDLDFSRTRLRTNFLRTEQSNERLLGRLGYIFPVVNLVILIDLGEYKETNRDTTSQCASALVVVGSYQTTMGKYCHNTITYSNLSSSIYNCVFVL